MTRKFFFFSEMGYNAYQRKSEPPITFIMNASIVEPIGIAASLHHADRPRRGPRSIAAAPARSRVQCGPCVGPHHRARGEGLLRLAASVKRGGRPEAVERFGGVRSMIRPPKPI